MVAIAGVVHGRGSGGLSVTGQESLRGPFEPFTLPVTFVAANDEAALRAAFTSETAGMILEPILGEGGVVPRQVPSGSGGADRLGGCDTGKCKGVSRLASGHKRSTIERKLRRANH